MAIEITTDPTALTFSEYEALDINTRLSHLDAVYERFHEKIEAVIGLGGTATWAFVCGPDCEIVQTAQSASEILTDDALWQKASEIGYAPYHFFKDEIVEDLAAA